MAVRFYQIRIAKVPVGTAVEYRTPDLQGTLQRTVTESGSRSDYELAVVEADDSQHQANLALLDVSSIEAEEAETLAPQYQPKRQLARFDSLTQKETRIKLSAADLTPFTRGKVAIESPRTQLNKTKLESDAAGIKLKSSDAEQ